MRGFTLQGQNKYNMGYSVTNRLNNTVAVNVEVRPLSAADLMKIAKDLSEINLEEMSALTKLSPVLALSAVSSVSEAYIIDDGSLS